MIVFKRIIIIFLILQALLFLTTCEILPLPTQSLCLREMKFLGREEIIIRAIENSGFHRRWKEYPGVPDITAKELYAANPNNWDTERHIFIDSYLHAWRVGGKERIEQTTRPGDWHGHFTVTSCGDILENFTMQDYDDEHKLAR